MSHASLHEGAPNPRSEGRDPASACLVAVVIAAGFSLGGHLNLDEGIYQLMARDFTATGCPGLWNGYEEFPSRELTFPAISRQT